MGSLLDVATGWTLYAGLIAVLGGCAARWILVPRASPGLGAPASALRRDAARLAFGGALLLLPAMALYFVRQLLEFRDPFVPWTEDAELLLTGTAWGTTWLWGVAGTAVASLAFRLATRGVASAWWPAVPLALALGVFPALTGHASGADGPHALLLTADVLHVWAAGAWAGGLAFMLYAERRWRAEGGTGILPALVPVFSPMAVACVALLVISGSVGAWAHLPSVSDLVGSRYGRVLLLKLVLVGVAFGLGFLNWRRLTPRLGDSEGDEALRRAATVELLVVQAVLIVTALLVRTAPPTG